MRTYVHMYIVLINSYQSYFKFKLVQQPQIKKQKTTTTTGQRNVKMNHTGVRDTWQQRDRESKRESAKEQEKK